MAKYTHEQLCLFAQPASETEETKLERAIEAVKRALGNSDIILSDKYEIFGQGSYANNTNVRNNSDVDINVCYTAAYYYELPKGKTKDDYGFSGNVQYSYSEFKNDIERMLVTYFGRNNVIRKNKCIHIQENTYRTEIDVVPTWEHRTYIGENNDPYNFYRGVKLWSDDGEEVINYPKQHKNNGINKNTNTQKRYKRLVRILKNVNIKMADSGFYKNINITSFLIECLMYNYPNNALATSIYDWNSILQDVIRYFWNKTREDCYDWYQFLENSELLYLMIKHKWDRSDVHEFMTKLWIFLEY